MVSTALITSGVIATVNLEEPSSIFAIVRTEMQGSEAIGISFVQRRSQIILLCLKS